MEIYAVGNLVNGNSDFFDTYKDAFDRYKELADHFAQKDLGERDISKEEIIIQSFAIHYVAKITKIFDKNGKLENKKAVLIDGGILHTIH